MWKDLVSTMTDKVALYCYGMYACGLVAGAVDGWTAAAVAFTAGFLMVCAVKHVSGVPPR